MNPLYDKLKREGLRVEFDHLRVVGTGTSQCLVSKHILRKDDGKNPKSIHARGGQTIARIKKGDDVVGRGETRCHSNQNYELNEGRNRALARAYRDMKAREKQEPEIVAHEIL